MYETISTGSMYGRKKIPRKRFFALIAEFSKSARTIAMTFVASVEEIAKRNVKP